MTPRRRRCSSAGAPLSHPSHRASASVSAVRAARAALDACSAARDLPWHVCAPRYYGCPATHSLIACRGAKQAKGQAYIKISEEEIADDYPLPQQYEMPGEEMDEFVVNGDEDLLLDVDPDCLPKMVRPHAAPVAFW